MTKRKIMLISSLLSMLLLASHFSLWGQNANYPFPQGYTYPGCIKPQENMTQAKLDEEVKRLYVDWVLKYLKQSNGVTPGGGYLVYMDTIHPPEMEKTTSRAHGMGMMITAMMAGADLSTIPNSDQILDAKVYFDGMYNMYDKHRSTNNDNLMSWIIAENEQTEYDGVSETNGDMDIAYALIMAHEQWGSNGAINYLEEAQRMITLGIKESEMLKHQPYPMIHDDDDWTSYLKEYGTSPSSWKPAHFKAFAKVTGDTFWIDLVDKIYYATEYLQDNYAPYTGLLPDYVIAQNDPPRPAYEGWWPDDDGWLLGPYDDDFGYEATIYPLRLAMDYAHYGDARAKVALDKINKWVVEAHTNPVGNPPVMEYDPLSIVCGYHLDGTKIIYQNDPPTWIGMSFIAPLTLSCIVNADKQDAVDKGWREMLSTPEGYYEDSVNLVCALLLTGNWFKPADSTSYPPAPTPRPPFLGNSFEDYKDYVPATYQPPLGRTVEQSVQFVSIGWADNYYPASLEWSRDMVKNKRNPAGTNNPDNFDNHPVSQTYYLCTFYANAPYQVTPIWQSLYNDNLHEIANGSNTGTGFAYDSTASKWRTEILECETRLEGLLGKSLKLYSWRTPNLVYGPALYDVLKETGYMYDSTIAEGYQDYQDGTNFCWPYTLDNGSPGHEAYKSHLPGTFELGSYPGRWELPAYVLMVPPADKCPEYGINHDLRKKLLTMSSCFCDMHSEKVIPSDYLLWKYYNLTAAEVSAILKYTLDMRLLGNRCPMPLDLSSAYYDDEWQKQNGNVVTTVAERRAVIEDFVNYALSKPEVRMVSNKRVLEWVTNRQTAYPTPTPTATPPATPTPPSLINIVLGKPCKASSEYGPAYAAPNAVDGNESTIWASKITSTPEYIYVDLGKLYKIRGVRLKWFDKYYATNYDIYLSNDGRTWNKVVSITGQNGGIDELISDTSVTTRYIGFYFTRANDVAYALEDLEVLGPVYP